jgi:thiamine-phosphate pyrophosphorylase
MMKAKKIRGLYALTPDLTDTEKLCHLVEASLLGGASAIQYRNKTASHNLRVTQACALLNLCRQHNVPLIINDYIQLCLTVDADGVHLGGSDGNLSEARQQLGEDKILGVSCYNRFELAQAAKVNGADYVAFGACFESNTKPDAVDAPLGLISRAQQRLNIPIVAIGGITLDNAALAINAGASSVAVISALFSAHDIKQTAQQFSRLFQ